MVIRWLWLGLLFSQSLSAQIISTQLISSTHAASPVAVTIEISEQKLYTEQSILVMLNVSSLSLLATLETIVDSSSHMLVKRLDGPISRYEGDKILYQYAYIFTPLDFGVVELPRITVFGTTQSPTQAFEQNFKGSRSLDILPSNEQVTPWLVLQDLTIQSSLSKPKQIEVGQPIEITYHMNALGLSGAQLPSLEDQLQGGDFKVYKSSTKSEGQLTKDATAITGSKIETYTLVPMHSGRSILPGLKIDWWNSRTQKVEQSRLGMRQFFVKGEVPKQQVDLRLPDKSLIKIAVPLLIIAGLVLSLGLMSLLRRRGMLQVLEEELTMMMICNVRRLSHFLIWLSPIRRFQRMRQIFIGSLPASYRLWVCVKLVEHETDPDNWSYMLRFLANKHLGFPAQASLHEMGQQICQCHPACDAQQMAELMRQLEANLYGQSTLDFKVWKKAFRRQLKPAWFSFFDKKPKIVRKVELPKLNPEHKDNA